MTINVPKKPGIYSIVIVVCEKIIIPIGILGSLSFSPGYYIYTGSAQGTNSMNLKARIHRHIQTKKHLHWHIDYLLQHEATSVLKVIFIETLNDVECDVTQRITKFNSVLPAHKGFGASDCQNRCSSHLSRYLETDLEKLMLRLNDVYKTFGVPYHLDLNPKSGAFNWEGVNPHHKALASLAKD